MSPVIAFYPLTIDHSKCFQSRDCTESARVTSSSNSSRDGAGGDCGGGCSTTGFMQYEPVKAKLTFFLGGGFCHEGAHFLNIFQDVFYFVLVSSNNIRKTKSNWKFHY